MAIPGGTDEPSVPSPQVRANAHWPTCSHLHPAWGQPSETGCEWFTGSAVWGGHPNGRWTILHTQV